MAKSRYQEPIILDTAFLFDDAMGRLANMPIADINEAMAKDGANKAETTVTDRKLPKRQE